MTCDEKKTSYAIDDIERAKKTTKCSCSDGEVKIESRSMIFMANYNMSRSISTFLIEKSRTNFIL